MVKATGMNNYHSDSNDQFLVSTLFLSAAFWLVWDYFTGRVRNAIFSTQLNLDKIGAHEREEKNIQPVG